jgi:hypothetical protein
MIEAVSLPTICCDSSINSALTPEVPRSSPKYISTTYYFYSKKYFGYIQRRNFALFDAFINYIAPVNAYAK